MWQTDEVTVVSGAGTASDPDVISASGLDGREPWSRDLNEFLQRCFFVTPALLHADLVDAAPHIELGDGGFAFTNALSILLNSTLLLSTPAAEDTNDGDWIESGLPFGIAHRVEERDTANVYIEFAPIDYISVVGGSTRLPRAVWLIRRHPTYWMRLYRQDVSSVHSEDISIRYDKPTGRFTVVEATSGLYSLK